MFFLRIFKSKQTPVLLFILALSIALWMKTIINPQSLNIPTQTIYMPLYNIFYKLSYNNPPVLIISGLILLLFICFLIVRLNVKFFFIEHYTYISAILFVLIASSYLQQQYAHPGLFACIPLLFALEKLFDSYKQKKTYPYLFDAVLLISIASLFYFNIIYLYIFCLIAMSILHSLTFRKLLISVLALFIPYIFFAFYYFFINNFNQFFTIINYNFQMNIPFPTLNIPYYAFYLYILLFTLIAGLKIIITLNTKKVRTRVYLKIILWLFVFSIIYLIVLPSVSIEMLFIISIPVSYILSSFFYSIRSKKIGEVLVVIMLGLVCYIQIVQ